MGIEFEHVAKQYPDQTMAVDDFSLVVPTGRTTVLVGSSGCGKTTLLRMVNRMVTPTAGRVLIDDEDVAGTDPVKLRRRIGYVMQNSGLLPHRRVLDNIATVPRLNGVSKGQAHEQALELETAEAEVPALSEASAVGDEPVRESTGAGSSGSGCPSTVGSIHAASVPSL